MAKDVGAIFSGVNKVLKLIVIMDNVNILKVILYTLNGWIVWYVNYISMKILKV